MNHAEKTFNNWLRGKLPGDYMRIENTTMQGVPDINCCWDGREIWIESKIYYPDYESPLLEKEQFAWGFRRTHNGGTVWVLALWGETIMAYRHKLVIEPVKSKYLRIVNAQVVMNIPRRDFANAMKPLFNFQ